jgi:hypothetical protein
MGTVQALQLLQPLHMASTGSQYLPNYSSSSLHDLDSMPTSVFMAAVSSDEGICKKMHDRIAGLSNEELRVESTENIQKLTSSIEKLLLTKLSFYSTSKHIYQFRLSFALQCFRCPMLDKRLHGMRELNHLCNYALSHGELAPRAVISPEGSTCSS